MENFVFWISLNLVLLILIFICIIYLRLPWFLEVLDKRTGLIKEFIEKHEAPFSIGFILLFSIEQMLLIIYIFLFKDDIGALKLIVSIFALVVISTSSLQALFLQIKRRYEKEKELVTSQNIDIMNRLAKRLKENLEKK